MTLRIRIQESRNPYKDKLKDFFAIIILLVASTSMSLWAFKENLFGLFRNKIPLAGDGLLTGIYIQSAQKSDYLSLIFQNVNSTQFGWPGKLDFTSYPVGNTQEMLAIKFFMDLTGIIDPSQVIHIFSILKAGPISIATFILCRLIGISRPLSAGIGLIFSLNTYNLIRAEGHFFLGLTWSIPLGLAAIFMAFNQAMSGKKPTRKIVFLTSFLSLNSFMTGFYYSIFLILFAASSLIFLSLRLNHEDSNDAITLRLKSIGKQLLLPFLVTLILVFGLALQTVPVLFRNLSISKLTGLADRSITESIIYSGTVESALFDLYALGLRILNRPDLIAYLQTRISWEASQLGALSGAILIGLLLLLLNLGLSRLLSLTMRKRSNGIKFDNATIFVLVMLTVSLLLYFVSPINFAISQVLPQIRAWGRLSLLISLFSLMLFGLLLSQLDKRKVTFYLLSLIMTLVPILEFNNFRIQRPTSLALNSVSVTQIQEIESTLSELKIKYPENCSIVNLPIYPFPEFDYADDKNIDYGQFQLPILDKGYFVWSYGGIKATENFRAWQPLVSEFLPLARASMADQISYGYTLNACGALIDRSYLNAEESRELEMLLKFPSICLSELTGPLIENRARFVAVEYRSSECRQKTNPNLEKLALESLGGNLDWRIDQSSDLGFNGSYQMFPGSKSINIRLRSTSPRGASSLVLRVRVVAANPTVNTMHSLTVLNIGNGEVASYRLTLRTDEIAKVELPATLMTGELERISLTLSSGEPSEALEWGVQLATRN